MFCQTCLLPQAPGQAGPRLPTNKQVAGTLANFCTDGITAKDQGVTVRAPPHRQTPVSAWLSPPGRQVEMATLAAGKQPYQSRLWKTPWDILENIENPEKSWKTQGSNPFDPGSAWP